MDNAKADGEDLWTEMERCRLVAVLVIDREEDAVPVAEALLAGGVDFMELTLRTPAAMGALRAIREALPEMTAGVGTVLAPGQVEEIARAGASFGVAPSVNPEVLREAAGRGLPFAPGVMTPTDIDLSLRVGCRVLKYFPAESSGGLPHLRNMAAPFAHLGVRFLPLGGISLRNLEDYLACEHVAAVGGSWIAPRELIQAGEWDKIEANAREARAVAG